MPPEATRERELVVGAAVDTSDDATIGAILTVAISAPVSRTFRAWRHCKVRLPNRHVPDRFFESNLDNGAYRAGVSSQVHIRAWKWRRKHAFGIQPRAVADRDGQGRGQIRPEQARIIENTGERKEHPERGEADLQQGGSKEVRQQDAPSVPEAAVSPGAAQTTKRGRNQVNDAVEADDL